MANIGLKPPSQVAQDYLDELKSLKPGVNTDQNDSDWYIRSRVNGSILSGVYADQRLIANDAFPQRARHDALQRFLEEYFGDEGVQGDFLPATQAQGNVAVTGTAGQVVQQGLQGVYPPNGNTYSSTITVTLDAIAGTGVIPFQSVAAGQAQNLNDGAILNFPSPPTGLVTTAVVSGGLSDARDPESDTQARSRILTRIRQPLGVGRVSDYIQYAMQANPAVVSASVSRFPYGLGTVGVYITSGTTNVDAAIDAGEDISIIPSDALVAEVQAYLNINRPVTDCVTVLKPVAVPINVTVGVTYSQGNGSTVLTGQTLTQDQLVQREVKRALYKTPVGGRVIGASGYMVASDIEETIDVKLSAEPVVAGSIPILQDRQVYPLSVTGYNRGLLPNETPIPGTISVVQL